MKKPKLIDTYKVMYARNNFKGEDVAAVFRCQAPIFKEALQEFSFLLDNEKLTIRAFSDAAN
jgi:hypothetical protein